MGSVGNFFHFQEIKLTNHNFEFLYNDDNNNNLFILKLFIFLQFLTVIVLYASKQIITNLGALCKHLAYHVILREIKISQHFYGF